MSRKQAVTTTTSNRVGLKWNVNELNRLHNEYELKDLDVYEIAALHKRGVSGILHKLAEEGLISSSWNDARGWEQGTTKQSLTTNKKTEKKALPTRAKKSFGFVDDNVSEMSHDNVISDSDSDEEYTLEDAQNDYDPFSYEDKINFFKGIFR